MVGMQPVSAPRIVSDQCGGTELADDAGHLPALVDGILEFAIDPVEEQHPVAVSSRWPGRPSMTAAADRHSASLVVTSARTSAPGSQLPLDPSVRTK